MDNSHSGVITGHNADNKQPHQPEAMVSMCAMWKLFQYLVTTFHTLLRPSLIDMRFARTLFCGDNIVAMGNEHGYTFIR